ncbi:arabinan endo-1,5-alpha-L-arabinosidase [Clostridium fungisolvens]|uniref:Extracellular endo-alpha-(1->5)-L-arabinanase n=1 Tax=Clostridium fungisolvens TaxID=1604897 RepID=A0A6V8SHR2_9CLOT|nr:arabinan endo-1,5-alpha-L-arabinosidase [Clostridium fungisolvens]GFP76045.1 Extracellular endo-alpha-(1->5)-L-arabinanase [Clostridium fungisolvens]
MDALNDKSKWGTVGTHDPSVFKDGDMYYVFSTDARVGGPATPGIQVRKSKDMINWQFVGQALEGVPTGAYEWTGANGLWAPDVTKVGDYYYLYYAASSFGKNKSYIGLERSKSIEGPWEDMGYVIKTEEGDKMNAIDPNIVFDKNGDMWMSYGSFWTGIYIVKLDKNTGKPIDSADKGKNISSRNNSVSGAVEGPYIIYNDTQKKYYLFESYDSLSKDYNVRVGRSDNIDGPYLDINGNDMTDTIIDPNEVGNKIMGGYKFGDSEGWLAPGHNSVLKDGYNYYIYHHIRTEQDPNWFYLNVRKIEWSKDGWPMVSPEKYAGEKEQKISKDAIAGQWDVILLAKDNNDIIPSEQYTFKSNGKIDKDNAKWSIEGDNNLTISLSNDEEHRFECKVIPAWDWENNKSTLVFTGIDKKGLAIWGKMSK